MTRHGRLPCNSRYWQPVATGGELNPHSDIDIMLLHPDRISNRERFETFQELLTEKFSTSLDLGWCGHASQHQRGDQRSAQ